MITFIYALIDPRTQEIRYIGKSVQPNTRLRQHLKSRRVITHCTLWIDTLLEAGLEPLMSILESVPTAEGSDVERWWIAEGKRAGLRLTNLTDGGEGVTQTPERRQHLSELFTGRTVSEEQKAQISATLMGHPITDNVREAFKKGSQSHIGVPNPHSDETRQKMSEAHTGKKRAPHSEETKEKMRQAALGRKHESPSEETRAKLSAANTGKTLTAEHKAKIGAANAGREFSDEHRQHLSEAHQGVPRGPMSDEHKQHISAARLASRAQEE